MRYLDMNGPHKKRDPNDPRRAKEPEGPKLGADPNERVPWTYGHFKPHYHVFKQLWPEPSLLKRKFGPKAETSTEIPKPIDHVQVPMRKVRSSTAVLEALSSTVRIDAGSVPFDLMDDPYLLPHAGFQAKDYRAAKASGRRVAQRIAEDMPYFFDFKFFRPDPVIHALESGKSDWEHEVSEEGSPDFDEIIKERLDAGRPDLALSAYERSIELQAQVSTDVMSLVFQVAAWHNLTFDSDFDALRPSENEAIEEQSHQRILNDHYITINSSRECVWADDGIAEDLWRRIPKTDALHCVFVQALVRHGATQRAYDHFKWMIAEDKTVDLPTFNALLTWHNEIDTDGQVTAAEPDDLDANNGKTDNKARKHDLKYREILTIMSERGVQPTTATFNACLHGLADKRMPFRKDNAETVALEMIQLGLKPTLGTLSLLIRAWRTTHILMVRRADWLLKIVEAGDVDLSQEDDYDGEFFPLLVNALKLEDLRLLPETVDLTLRVHKVIRERRDYLNVAARKLDMFRYFLKESLWILIYNGQMDEAMRLFSSYVPGLLQFNRVDYGQMMQRLAEVGPIAVQHVVTLGNHINTPLTFDATASPLIDSFAELLVPSSAEDQSELEALVAVAANFFNGYVRTQDIRAKRDARDEYAVHGPETPSANAARLSGHAYGNIILTLAHGSQLDDAISAFSYYRTEQNRVVGAPPVEGVTLLMRRVAKSKKLTNQRKARVMVDALKFLDEMGAKRHLAEGLDLMIEDVTLDTTSALIVAELKKELDRNMLRGKSKSPAKSLG